MTSDELFRAEVTTCAAGADTAEDLRLLRRYEQVLRFTRGELFLPMPVEDYLENCSLWRTGLRRGRGRGGAAERLCARGGLTPAHLAQISPAGGGSFRFASWSGDWTGANSARGGVIRAALDWPREAAALPPSAC